MKKRILSFLLTLGMATGFSCTYLSEALTQNSSAISSSSASTPSSSIDGEKNGEVNVGELKTSKEIIGDKETDDAMEIIKKLSTEFGNRITESEANLKAGEYIKEKLKASGFKVETEKFENESSRWKGDNDGITSGINIIGTLQKPDPSKKIVIFSAHYDSFLGSPGANDNGTGVAANLVLADSFKNKDLPFNPVFLFVDAEELGLLGSQDYVRRYKDELKKDTELVINIDMTGKGNRFQICNVKKASSDSFYHNLAKKTGEKLGFEMESVFLFGSDYAHFEVNGIPAIGIANDSGVLSGNDEDYHTKNDKFENVDRAAVKNTLILLFNITENIGKR